MPTSRPPPTVEDVTRTRPRALPTAALVLSLAALTACGGGGSEAPGPGAQPQAQPGATLRGTVGTAEDPEAYEIALTLEDGTPVEALAAGAYTLVVEDFAQIHNFHLSGSGVDAATEVRGTGEDTFQVTLAAGEYTYICDPHPNMKGAFRVV